MTTALDQPVADMNTTPLIDVMLVLLIMFIVTVPVMTHAIKIDLPTPHAHPPTQNRPQVVDLEIDFDGSVVWNGTVIPRDARM
jgi:biopolymer transport protein ExbD